MSDMQKDIDHIMDEFPFHKVALVIETLDWRWATVEGVPKESDLRRRARSLLKEVAINKYEYVETGGFAAERKEDCDGEPYLNLSFGFHQDSSLADD